MCRVAAVIHDIQEDSTYVLRHYVDHADGSIVVFFDRNVESRVLGAKGMISQRYEFIEQGVNVCRPVLAASATGMQQHVFDDTVSALAVSINLA